MFRSLSAQRTKFATAAVAATRPNPLALADPINREEYRSQVRRVLDNSVGVFHGHKAAGQALFDGVCRNLESDYFGLEFIDSYGNRCWLEKDKSILRRFMDAKSDARFFFIVKFHTPNPDVGASLAGAHFIPHQNAAFAQAVMKQHKRLILRNYCSDSTRTFFTDGLEKFKSSLQNEFKDMDISLISVPNKKIVIKSSEFNAMSKAEVDEKVCGMVPAELQSCVQIETRRVAGGIDRKVKPVRLQQSVPFLSAKNIPSTPQSHLDDAVYQLSHGKGALASECLWLCGSLALKHFAHAYRCEVKGHGIKSEFVYEIAAQFGDEIDDHWKYLESCHQNSYEDYYSLKMVERYSKNAEKFCNLLFQFHSEEDPEKKFKPSTNMKSRKAAKRPVVVFSLAGRGFGAGKWIKIVATPTASDRFGFSLVDEPTDGPGPKAVSSHFYFSARFNQKQVVRNNFIAGKGWQTEELDGEFPFLVGQQFVINFVGMDENKIKVLVDGRPFCKFSPRGGGDLSAVDNLEISGSLRIAGSPTFSCDDGGIPKKNGL